MVEQLTLSLLLLTFELMRTVECVRALSLFSVHCNAKVDCVFELSKKDKKTQKEKKKREDEKRKEKNIKRDKKRKEKKVRGK